MSEVIGRLNRTIEAQGPDLLLVQSRDALVAAYATIATLHECIAALQMEAGATNHSIPEPDDAGREETR